MKTISLKAKQRNTKTKGQINQLRKSGLVPGNVYGENINLQIQIDERELKKILYTPNTYLIHLLVQLEEDEKTYPVILKEAQFNKVTDRPIHVDFQVVNENKPVVVTLPVVTKGQSEGVKAGGKLQLFVRRVKVKGLVKDIPDALELDISNLNIGKTIVCGDIKINDVTLLHPENLSIVGVKVTRNVIEEAAATAKTTPSTTSKAAEPAATKK